MKRLCSSSCVFIVAFLVCSCTTSADRSRSGQTESADEGSARPAGAGKSVAIPGQGIEWLDYDEGMRLVVGTSRFAVLYFDTSDCAPCMWMDDSLFSNPEVIAAIRKDFVPIRIQSARADTLHYQGMAFTGAQLRKIFMLPGYPMVLFVEGERNQIIGGQASIIRPRRFLDYMRYHTSRAYKTVTFEEFLDNPGRREDK